MQKYKIFQKGAFVMDFLCEHIVERKKEVLYKFKKTAIILSWVVIPIVLIIVCFGVASINIYFEFLSLKGANP
jgi:hypothetical protein